MASLLSGAAPVAAGTENDTTSDTAGAPTRRAWSLRSRLMWLATLTTLMAWLAGGVGALIAAYQEGEKLYDEQLRDVAQVVLSFATHEIDEIRQDGRTDIVHEETAVTLDHRYAYQIWSKTGDLLLVSHNASRQPYAPLSQDGLLDRTIDGRPYCVYSLRSSDGAMLIQVAEDESQRTLFRPSLSYWLLGFFLVSSQPVVAAQPLGLRTCDARARSVRTAIDRPFAATTCARSAPTIHRASCSRC